MSEEKTTVKQQANCLQCENLHNCGTVDRWLTDLGKIKLSKMLEEKSENSSCLDFCQNTAIGSDLSDVLYEMIEISKNKKYRLKQQV